MGLDLWHSLVNNGILNKENISILAVLKSNPFI